MLAETGLTDGGGARQIRRPPSPLPAPALEREKVRGGVRVYTAICLRLAVARDFLYARFFEMQRDPLLERDF